MAGSETDKLTEAEEAEEARSAPPTSATTLTAPPKRGQDASAGPGQGGYAGVGGEPPPKKQANPNRLSVNLPPDIADILRSIVKRRGISITDATIRAISLLKFVEDAREEGEKVLIERPGQAPRELVFFR